MNVKKTVNVVATLLFTIAVVICVYFFFDNLVFELIGGFCGFVIGYICTSVLNKLLDYYNDRTKLVNASFNYDEQEYCKKVKIGEHYTKIWYKALVSDLNAMYTVDDSPEKYFTLDPLIQINYTAIIKAHNNSFTDNPMMVRLDDAAVEGNDCRLLTSRTSFFNDLATNRSMDFEFSDGLTVRKIYESNSYINTLANSKMSNHIGINVLIFQKNQMILVKRGAHGTTSKNSFTSGLAFGLSESDWQYAAAKVGGSNGNKIFDAVILRKTAKDYGLSVDDVEKAYESGKIKIYNLGFGRVLYMGGKPQFYFAMTVDKDFALLKKSADKNKNQIDYNKARFAVNSLKLVCDGKDKLKVEREDGKRMMRSCAAETSFFINYWHLLNAEKISDVPSWVYDIARIDKA